jgi:hypothetical protein
MRVLPRVPGWIRREARTPGSHLGHGTGVSLLILRRFSVAAAPGDRIKCPFCGHHTFCIKRDDTIGKCFHPSCGEFLTARPENRDEIDDLDDALRPVFRDLHKHLLDLAASLQPNAYDYVVNVRRIHPRVVMDSMIGAVQSGYDPTAHFDAAIKAVDSGEKVSLRGLAPAEERTEMLRAAFAKLKDCLREGWVAFFYTDEHGRIVAIRFREPYAKRITYFKPTERGGVFNHALFAHKS